jgi:hypothetical protein
MDKSRFHSLPGLALAGCRACRMLSRHSPAWILIAMLLAGGCGTAVPTKQPSKERSSAAEKYEECMRDMRVDLFAERICEGCLTSADSRQAPQRAA